MGNHDSDQIHQVSRQTSNANTPINSEPAGHGVSAPGYQLESKGKVDAQAGADSYQKLLDVIQQQRDRWGTDEDAIYDAIRACPQRKKLKNDMYALHKLRKELSGHDLWKAYLLVEYGDESRFPDTIKKVWKATKGMGTDEKMVMEALRAMDNATRKTFGLGYILKRELSGKDLRQALAIMNSRSSTGGDSIQGNIFGNKNAKDGVHELHINFDNAAELIGADFQGNETTGLVKGMKTLYGFEAEGKELQGALEAVSAARGLDVTTAKSQYEKAKNLQVQGVNYYKSKHKDYDPRTDHPAPPLTAKNMAFTGTNAQLSFGKIVGDVFGIDAVFGSLMSPTGGMAGPGNSRVRFVSDGSATATHGAVHDAAGYLKNCFNIGPGYDYFGSEPGADPTAPLAGQTNIRWWIEQYESRGIDRGYVEGPFQSFLANNAHKGAAFAKDFRKLSLDQKKENLGYICGVTSVELKILKLDNDDRIAKVQEMMNVSSDEDKEALANHYYENDTFNSIIAARGIGRIMRPHVDPDVYSDYILRMSI